MCQDLSVALGPSAALCAQAEPLTLNPTQHRLQYCGSAPLRAHRPLAAGYHTVKGLAAPLQDLAQACAVLPTCLAFSNQGRVGGKEDTL